MVRLAKGGIMADLAITGRKGLNEVTGVTVSGLVVATIVFVAQHLGVDIDEKVVVGIVTFGTALVSAAIRMYNNWMKHA
jgi:small basic protein